MLLLSFADFFFKINFSTIFFSWNTITVSNGLDRDQKQLSVSLVLGPKCLQRLSAEHTCPSPARIELSINRLVDNHTLEVCFQSFGPFESGHISN